MSLAFLEEQLQHVDVQFRRLGQRHTIWGRGTGRGLAHAERGSVMNWNDLGDPCFAVEYGNSLTPPDGTKVLAKSRLQFRDSHLFHSLIMTRNSTCASDRNVAGIAGEALGSYIDRQGRDMRFGTATILLTFFVSITRGQVNSPSPQDLPSFEAVARQPGTKIMESMEVGHLTGGDRHAIFTTLIIEDPTPELRRLRGVRIDLSQPFWKSSVYVDESLLEPLDKSFDELARNVFWLRDRIEQGQLSGNTFTGFCPPDRRHNRVRYPLTVSFTYQGPDFLPTLIINNVWFPGLMPSQVSDVLGKAIDDLKSR
jgi:hypothetical protein